MFVHYHLLDSIQKIMPICYNSSTNHYLLLAEAFSYVLYCICEIIAKAIYWI